MLEREKYYQRIRDYYQKSNWLYKYVWYRGESLGLHFGFADETTKNHTEALNNQYKYVIEKAKIERGMKVLDAGCGVGGASIYIAKHTQASVVGITLVKEQVMEAKNNAVKAKLDKLPKFIVGDYTNTGLKSGTFDVVFGIESVCYSEPKKSFLDEAYRLLKPGGVLVLTDGYRMREAKNDSERRAFAEFCDGWRLYNLVTYQEMSKLIKSAGFVSLKVESKTEAIQMSLNIMRRLVRWQFWGNLILGWTKLSVVEMMRLNKQAMQGWIEGVDSGLFGYYGHIAKKPEK